MLKDGEYTTQDLREVIASWRGGIVVPDEALEVAAVLELILDAAERLIGSERDRADAVLDLQEAIGIWSSEENKPKG